MGRMSARHSLRRSAPASTVSLIDEWSMDVADANTTELIGLWSMDGALRDIDDCLGSAADAPAIVPAERAWVCGTAYDVPILVKHPEDGPGDRSAPARTGWPTRPTSPNGCWATRRARMLRSTSLMTTLVVLAVALVAAQAKPGAVWRRAIASDQVLRVSRVNISTGGRAAKGQTLEPVLSASGRYVAFASAASTLVRNDRNKTSDVFVRDLRTSRTIRVSVSSDGRESDGVSLKPSISADGRVVAFPSSATNLVLHDRNGVPDIFVRDRASGTTARVSVGGRGEANALSLASLVSADEARSCARPRPRTSFQGIETGHWTSSSPIGRPGG